MQAEYDFSKAERGKYYRSLENGYTVRVRQSDGTRLSIITLWQKGPSCWRLTCGNIFQIRKVSMKHCAH